MTQNVKNKELVVFCHSQEKVSVLQEQPKMMVDNWDRNGVGFRRMPIKAEKAEIEVIKDILDCNVSAASSVTEKSPDTTSATDGLYHPPGPHVHQNYGNDREVIDHAQYVHSDDHAHRKQFLN